MVNLVAEYLAIVAGFQVDGEVAAVGLEVAVVADLAPHLFKEAQVGVAEPD